MEDNLPSKDRFKREGSISFHDGEGNNFQFLCLQSWKPNEGGILLLYDLYQLKGIVGNFSEVALDIIEFSPDKVVFHSPPVSWLTNEPISKGLIKFALIKRPFWNKLLYQLGEVVVFQSVKTAQDSVHTKESFPLNEENVKEIQLKADGGVKIIKG